MAIPDFLADSERASRTIGLPDTHALRVLDHRQGGNACLGAVRGRTGDGRLMLGLVHTDLARTMNHSHIRTAIPLLTRGLAAAESLGSARVRDRIRPLGEPAERHDSHAGSRELAARITATRARRRGSTDMFPRRNCPRPTGTTTLCRSGWPDDRSVAVKCGGLGFVRDHIGEE